MAQKDKKNVPNKKGAAKEKESSSEISRRFKQNPALFIGTVVVLVLVIVSFVLVPAIVPQAAGNAGDLTFGYYDNVPIAWVPGNMFAQYREQAAYELQAQGADPNDFRAAAEIWRRAYEATVVHTAVLQMMKKSNYTTPVKTVDREVAMLPQFQENGRFSRALYERMSESARLVQWRQVSDELSKKMYYNDYFDLMIPSTEVEFIANMSSVMREFQLVSFKVDDFPEAEYLAYAKEHPELFDSIHLSVISISSSEREAKRILASIKDGTASFEDSAKEYSKSYADRGGDMGIRYIYELDSVIPDADSQRIILNLGRGEISELIRTGDNWSIFRIEEELKKADFEDSVVMERARFYMVDKERGRMEDWAEGRANEFITEAKELGFEEAARQRNMEIHKFGPLPINFGSVDLLPSLTIPGFDEQVIQNMSTNENFWTTAFIKTGVQTPSQPLVQGDNVFVLFPLEQTNANEESVEEISSMYSSYWVNYMAQQYIQEYFLNSAKMEDDFWPTYFRIFYP